jgi:hypothetical protein
MPSGDARSAMLRLAKIFDTFALIIVRLRQAGLTGRQ